MLGGLSKALAAQLCESGLDRLGSLQQAVDVENYCQEALTKVDLNLRFLLQEVSNYLEAEAGLPSYDNKVCSCLLAQRVEKELGAAVGDTPDKAAGYAVSRCKSY